MTVGIVYPPSTLSGHPPWSRLLSIWGRQHRLCPTLLAARLAKKGQEEEGSPRPGPWGSNPGGIAVAAHPRPRLLAPQLCS